MVVATDTTHTHWVFCFGGSGLLLLVSGSWSGSMCRVHIVIQELQAVVPMLLRLAFQLYGKLVALLLDNSTAKGCLCNEGGTVFFSFQTCLLHIESGSKAWYSSCSSIHSYPSQCGR